MTTPLLQADATILNVQAQADPLGLTWQIRIGTVISGADEGKVDLRLDGDATATAVVRGQSMIGRLAAGDRVYVVSAPPAGHYVTGYTRETAGAVIARARRATSTTASAAETGILRIDNVQVKAGWLYWIGSGPVLLDVSAGGDHCALRLRYDNTGAAATTASTDLTQAQIDIADAANGDSISVGGFYHPTTDEILSVILTHDVLVGAGTVLAFASSTVPIELFVEAKGADPGDTGVIL